MADCNILEGGISIGCENNVGGIRKLWLKEHSKVTYTIGSPSNKIATLTVDDSSKFYEFEFTKNTSTYVEDSNTASETGTELTTQTITLVLNRREQAKRDTILLLGRFKNLVGIVLDSNGLYWYFGETEGINLTNKTGGPGTAKTDRNGYTITFVGSEPEEAREIEESAVLAVIEA